jgi:hypothetical protein
MQTQTVITKEVATELLCTPGLRMTNKERKQFHRARWTLLNPEKFDPLGIEHRLDYRLCQRNWKQLCKWLKRATTRRRDAQAKFQIIQRRQEKLGKKTGQPSDSDIQELLVLQQATAALNAKARILDIFIDAVESEIGKRRKLWESVKTAGAPAFARTLKKALCSRAA